MQIVRVNLAQRSYDIEIDQGNLAEAGRFLIDRAAAAHVVLITDDHVQKPHAMRAAESLGDRDIEVDVIVVEPGEESKSPEAAAALWQALLDLGADRKTIVVAVGGGVVGDLAGFVAATYARGLRFLQIPTSLLAQVDSSVGGKAAINLPEAKNMVGALLQPLGVLIDTATLATLPANEFRAGLAEVVKYGAVCDAEFFQYLEDNAAALIQREEDVLVNVIARCCRLKADVVERDERDESGLRAVLNFGHTFGHAFESVSRISPLRLGEGQGVRAAPITGQLVGQVGNLSHNSPHPNPLPKGEGPSSHGTLSHGEAVAMGMMCAARLAERAGRVDDQFTARLGALLKTFGLPLDVPKLDPRQVLDAMMHDKKTQHDELRFVLPSRLGQAELVGGVNQDDVRAILPTVDA